jgi:hypothetical protein
MVWRTLRWVLVIVESAPAAPIANRGSAVEEAVAKQAERLEADHFERTLLFGGDQRTTWWKYLYDSIASLGDINACERKLKEN